MERDTKLQDDVRRHARYYLVRSPDRCDALGASRGQTPNDPSAGQEHIQETPIGSTALNPKPKIRKIRCHGPRTGPDDMQHKPVGGKKGRPNSP